MENFYEIVRRIGPSECVIEMHRHYDEKRFFRTEDIGRVLGDSCEGVSMPKSEKEARDYLLSFVE